MFKHIVGSATISASMLVVVDTGFAEETKCPYYSNNMDTINAIIKVYLARKFLLVKNMAKVFRYFYGRSHSAEMRQILNYFPQLQKYHKCIIREWKNESNVR